MIKQTLKDKYNLSVNKMEPIQNTVEIEDIIPLQEFNPREKVNQNLVDTLVEAQYIPAIKLAYFPEISDKLIIVDGNHRYTSRLKKGDSTINAIIYEYSDEVELFKEATIANLTHGQMLNKEERITSIARLIKSIGDDFSAAKLATELGGVDAREVRKIFAWSQVVDILGRETLGFNISKGDILYRLISSKGDFKKTPAELIEFYEKFGHLKFLDLQEAIKVTLMGKEVEVTDLALDKISDEGALLEDSIGDIEDLIMEEEDLEEEDDLEFTDNVEKDDVYAKDILEDLKSEVEYQLNFVTNMKMAGSKIKKYIDYEKDLRSITDSIEKIKKIIEG